MRNRVTTWRPPPALSQSPSHTHPYSLRPHHPQGSHRTYAQERKTFRRHEGDDGQVFYTLPPNREYKQKPRPLEPHELFQMPNLVLDLDALSSNRVREYDASSEDVNSNQKYKATENELHARQMAGEIRDMVTQRRRVTPQMVVSSINPWRVTPHDIMSVALRGVLEDVVPQSSEPPPAEGPRKSRITKLTQTHKAYHARHPTQRVHSDILQRQTPVSEGALTTIESLVVKGDPRRKPDFFTDLHSHSGIPSLISKDEMNLLRWMMVKKEASHLSKGKAAISESRPLTLDEVLPALELQESFTGVRRIAFQSLAEGLDLNGTREGRDTKTSKAMSAAIRHACVRFLDHQRQASSPQEILTCVNNLAQAVPRPSDSMRACILGVRLRCLAEMSLIDVTSQVLNASADSTTGLVSDTGIQEDLAVTLEAWNKALGAGTVLQEASERRRLFQVATGSSAANGRATLRHMLSRLPDRSSIRLRVCRAYITLLGSLGAPRTLYKEWDLITSSLRSHADADDLATHFLETLSKALERFGCSYDNLVSKMSLAECAALDEKSIGSRPVSSVMSGSTGRTPRVISFHALDDLISLPFDQCIVSIRNYSEH